ncbi:xanthine dehydrogenase small subunit [Sneathiella sp.]|jgi:xanthine dehydrogenase small subunit|uniref:xanthine dehydrogenase small subunit n=1 Tax=Sneathiella sp. TaxID=1964365 RepID=UPI0039E52B69
MRHKIRFVHNGQIRELENCDPTQSVLNFLRYEDALTGTKEGCAEGDCGACTVVLGDLQKDGSVRYQAVNACIQFMPMLDGKELLTIEDLKSPNGDLHPVQDAMVKNNATQCGFCTPGFVMSIFAERQGRNSKDAADINDVLAGNLCRCTGYGTIIQAAKDAADHADTPSFDPIKSQTAGHLRELKNDPSLGYQWHDRRYFAPKTTEELTALLEDHPNAVLLSGSTDVGLWVSKLHKELKTIIYLGQIEELQQIKLTETDLTIGAGVTYSEAWPVLSEHFEDLGELVRRIASTQIRNSGTIGGNIANGSPIGDMPPALIALNATLTLQSATGRREIALEDFFIEYGKQDLRAGEFVEKVSIPLSTKENHFRNYKISKRFDQDISAVCGAFYLSLKSDTVEDVRICYGGMAGTPLRASLAEAELRGKVWSQETVQQAMALMTQDYQPMSDMRASSEYRMMAAQNLLQKFFVETTAPEIQTRLVGKGGLSDA